MSSKIYFNEQGARRPLSYYIIKAVSSTLTRIAPSFTIKQTKKLLLTPAKSRKRQSIPTHFSQSSMSTEYGDLHTVSIGEGKTVVLTHGWSGSSAQFYPLMERIAQAGFKAVAFDHFAHGKSHGQFANLPLFIKGLEAILTSHAEHLIGVISHSMGTVAALNATKSIPHVLIAPTFGFYDAFENRIISTGISKKAFKTVLTQVENEHNMAFSDILPEQHLIGHSSPITAIHDKGDKYALFSLSQQQAEKHAHFNLHSVEGLGHGRIINGDITWQYIQQTLLQR